LGRGEQKTKRVEDFLVVGLLGANRSQKKQRDFSPKNILTNASKKGVSLENPIKLKTAS